ncbi:putative sulfoacetate transporter SauU [Dyadobacter sp. CECT 9275]|uniref:Sulfoacetate transporter SauU n=1 Tax=Dyadobacter helix TaxID=2822344 RepID=A0A916NKK7_9BACT|nr:MFS transporter [Dyadobacter sp. CECT 9275]CAG4995139.1 putative sulfoacetate transporter SauU [Dyadobacter sp. CECT 9275]
MKKRYQVLFALSLLSVITFLDRVAISVAGPKIMTDLDLSKEQLGWILGIFALAYCAFEIPTGLLGDRLGAKKVLIRVVLWWSVFTVFTGFATGFGMLLIIRFLFGAGEAGAYPNTAIVLSKWFPVLERGRAQAWIWSASRMGGALTPFLVIPIQTHFGWRASFLFLGVLGILWVVFWKYWFKEQPSEMKGISEKELSEITSHRNQPEAHPRFSWTIFRNRNLLLLMAMYYCYASGAFFFQAWLPTYLQKGRGLNDGDMSFITSFSFVLGALGCLSGGYVCDYLVKRMGPRWGRASVALTGLGLSGLFMLISVFITDNGVATVLLSAGLGLMDFTIPASWSTAMDIGGKNSGFISGAMNTAGQVGSTMNTIGFGYLVTAFGNNYHAPVMLLAILLIAGALLWLKIDATKKIVF